MLESMGDLPLRVARLELSICRAPFDPHESLQCSEDSGMYVHLRAEAQRLLENDATHSLHLPKSLRDMLGISELLSRIDELEAQLRSATGKRPRT